MKTHRIIYFATCLLGCAAELGVESENADRELSASTSRGRLVQVFDSSGIRAMAYDARGLVTSSTRTLASGLGGAEYTYSTTYDRANRPLTVIYPGAGLTLTHGYDRAGRPQEVNHGNTPLVSSMGYTALGQPVAMKYGDNTIRRWTYYARDHRPQTIETRNSGGTALETLTYVYDDDGNVTEQTVDRPGEMVVRGYGYDALHRLVSVTEGQSTKPYRYDAVGNLVGFEQTNQVYADAAHAHAVSRVTGRGDYGYDANGNLTGAPGSRVIRYNAYNYPTHVGTQVEINNGTATRFIYDGDNTRVRKVDTTGTTTYIGNQVVHLQGNTTTTTNYVDIAGMRVAELGATTRYYHNDHLGSPSLITSGGAVTGKIIYDPFGTRRQDTSNARYTFNGKEETAGYYDYGARQYDPTIGRFISPDSVIPDPTNPQALNRYSYVYNNPLGYTDPTGHWPDWLDKASDWVRRRVFGVKSADEKMAEWGDALENGVGPRPSSLTDASRSDAIAAYEVGNAPMPATVWDAMNPAERGVYILTVLGMASGGGGVYRNIAPLEDARTLGLPRPPGTNGRPLVFVMNPSSNRQVGWFDRGSMTEFRFSPASADHAIPHWDVRTWSYTGQFRTRLMSTGWRNMGLDGQYWLWGATTFRYGGGKQ